MIFRLIYGVLAIVLGISVVYDYLNPLARGAPEPVAHRVLQGVIMVVILVGPIVLIRMLKEKAYIQFWSILLLASMFCMILIPTGPGYALWSAVLYLIGAGATVTWCILRTIVPSLVVMPPIFDDALDTEPAPHTER